MRVLVVAAVTVLGAMPLVQGCSSKSTAKGVGGAGTSGSGAAAGSGAVAGAGGTAGGAAASGSGGVVGVGGGSGAGGSAGTPQCTKPVKPTGAKVLFTNTLNDVAAITSVAGSSSSPSLSKANFALGVCDEALNFESSATWVAFPGAPNIDYAKGSLSLWYRPNYNTINGEAHDLLRTDQLSSKGGFRLWRTKRNDNEHTLSFEYRNPPQPVSLSSAAIPAATMPEGKWTFISISWEVGQNLKLWVRDKQVDYLTTSTMPAQSLVQPERLIYFGRGKPGQDSAKGWIDEIIIYDTAW